MCPVSVNLRSVSICIMADSNKICKTCHRKVQSFSMYLQCQNCNHKQHIQCVRLDNDACNITHSWYCPPCIQTILPFNHFDEDEELFGAVVEQRLSCSFQLHKMNSRVFVPFEINQELNTRVSDFDPDLQLYIETNYLQNMKYDYCLEDSFSDCFSESKTRLLMHIFSFKHHKSA